MSWSPPEHSCWNGIITNYTIQIQSLGPVNSFMTAKIQSNDSLFLSMSHILIYPEADQEFNNDPDPRRSISKAIVPEGLLIRDLQPFFKYTFSIYMSNIAGNGAVTSSEIFFLPGRGMIITVIPSPHLEPLKIMGMCSSFFFFFRTYCSTF